MKKKTLVEEIYRDYLDVEDISDVIAFFQKHKNEAEQKGFRNITVSFYGEIMEIYGDRLETNEEFEERKNQGRKARKQKERQKQEEALRELKLYEELKRKYEGGL